VPDLKAYEPSVKQLRTNAQAQGTVVAADVSRCSQALARGWDPPAIAKVLGFDVSYQARILEQLVRMRLA
jgi:hypothetical protein